MALYVVMKTGLLCVFSVMTVGDRNDVRGRGGKKRAGILDSAEEIESRPVPRADQSDDGRPRRRRRNKTAALRAHACPA